jgi:hypothetical protein
MPMATTSPTATKTPPAGPARSRFKNQIPTTATKALVHHTRKKGISNRHERTCEKMNSGDWSPKSGRRGIANPTMTATAARRSVEPRMSEGDAECIVGDASSP